MLLMTGLEFLMAARAFAGELVTVRGVTLALGLLEVFGSPRGRRLLATGALLGGLVLLAVRPPVQVVPPGGVGVRINRLTGGIGLLAEGPVVMVPLMHELRRYPLRDQVYRP